ncbi:hypothetical protein Mal52_10470 [Symmachiella dynata]|uniref:Uncharacterized protein n=1 Tax=Symmachiella dynata TaxID=2527995 RepID=A0A517ZJD2_9PLAN|nr:hypothetical protein [Symmachiella dynata]QDU42584.1 hypothetical protein Mal52_10470 [Symmachiella dynata]
MSGFGQEALAGSLFAHWSDNFPLAVTTVYPGTQIDAAGQSEWLEIWINAWQRDPRRSAGKEQVDVSVTVHCFVERTLDKGRILELADATKSTLEHQQVSVTDQSLSDPPVVGHLQLFETQTRTMTRRDRDAGRHGLQHVVLVTSGVATEV